MASLHIALKEWAVVCDLLLAGRLAILLRKGGVLEAGGPGRFELEHPRFALFPSWAHQRAEMLKPEHRTAVAASMSGGISGGASGGEPSEIPIRGWAEAVRIWRVADPAVLQPGGPLDALHPWSPAQIEMRLSYKPKNPLYLLALRAYRLGEPRTLANRPEYEGCRSWVPLGPGDGIETAGSSPALDEAAFAGLLGRLDAAMRGRA